jgi:hypothetical protein
MSMTAGALAHTAIAARDRRQFPRVRGPFDGSWAGAAGNGTARIWDLSEGGCYIDALNDQRVGEELNVSIDVPEGLVSARGQIVYSVPNQGFAVKFVTLDGPSSEALRRAVARLLSEGRGM